MKNKKGLFNFLFLLLCLGVTFHFLFKGEDLATLMVYMRSAHPGWWLFGALLVVLFIMSESFVMHYLLKTLKEDTELTRCFLYSFTGFFFCLVTPGASGGQPVQLLFMKKDGIPVHVSTLVLLIITIAYKVVLIIFSLLVLLFRPPMVMSLIKPALGWMILGSILTSISVFLMLALIFRPEIVEKAAFGIFRLVRHITKSKKVEAFESKLRESVTKYSEVAGFLRTHRTLSLRVLVMTGIQRNLLFAVTFLVLLSFGIHTLSFIDTVTLQAMISVGVDMLPVPGGMGMSEHLYSIIFKPVCGEALTLPSLLVVRGLTYYTQLLISAAMTAVAYMRVFGKTKKGAEQ